MSRYFPKLRGFEWNLKDKLHLSSYTTIVDLENATGVDASKFAKKVDLASSK